MADGRHVGKFWKCYNTPTDKPTWTWSHPTNTSTAKLFSWYWSLLLTVSVLVLWGVEIKNVHNFDET